LLVAQLTSKIVQVCFAQRCCWWLWRSWWWWWWLSQNDDKYWCNFIL